MTNYDQIWQDIVNKEDDIKVAVAKMNEILGDDSTGCAICQKKDNLSEYEHVHRR